MEYSSDVISFSNKLLKVYSLNELKKDVGNIIHDLSSNQYAESNINQIIFYSNVLHYLKYSDNEKSS